MGHSTGHPFPRRITDQQHEALFDASATRQIEQAALATLPPHTLMARAGLAVARLAQALAPHARCIWVACGPGNNGGDGLVAATHLHRQSRANGGRPQIVVTLCGDPARLPPDAALALTHAQAAGVRLADAPPVSFDLAIDALLGIGRLRPAHGMLAEHLRHLQTHRAPVLCVDLPSGLDGDTGAYPLGALQAPPAGERHTLSLLTLKPGLFTANGRDQAGTVWLDDLGCTPPAGIATRAFLHGAASQNPGLARPHTAHKGSQGDVLVLGGQDIGLSGCGMTGAAVLAARAALHAGAGRVYLSLLGNERTPAPVGWDPACPELMLRHWQAIAESDLLEHASVVCGCGGGDAVRVVLHEVLQRARTLVLDADGLNAVAGDAALALALRERATRGQLSVLTPHPLEAARLLDTHTDAVMADRLLAAQSIAKRYAAICVLKGSGTVTCTAGSPPRINSSGNAALATAGTGDVLAGLIGAALASTAGQDAPLTRVADAVHHHGRLADRWVERYRTSGEPATLTAGALARSAGLR
jgi:hydroxyethylthiazole kinase-like uncharacterized protein yjeF